jgi:hypothetical protein
MTAAGTIYWVGSLKHPVSGAITGMALFIGASQTVLLATGDPSPAPNGGTIASPAIDQNVRFSASGNHWILTTITTAPAQADNWLILDGNVAPCAGGGLVGEGELIPVAAGGDGTERWKQPMVLHHGVNDAGDYFFVSATTRSVSEHVLVKNGVIRSRTGDIVDGLTLAGGASSEHMNENGDIASVRGTVELGPTLFLNGAALARPGDVVDWTGDGVPDPGFVLVRFIGDASLTIGPRAPNGQLDAYFVADVDVDGSGSAPWVRAYLRVRVGMPSVTYCHGDGSGTACPCGNSGTPGRGCANSIDANGAQLASSGNASIGYDTLALQGSGMPDSFALYFQGSAAVSGGAGAVFGDGLRCVQTSTVRLKTAMNGGGASMYPQPGETPVSVRGMVTAPGTRYYQVWYRNAASFCTTSTFNLSNGLHVEWAN